MIASPDRPVPSRIHRIGGAVSVVLVLIAAVACDKVPLTAPTGSTLTISASANALPFNGVAEVSAAVTESSGTPVHNGTLVTFTTTLGTLDPAEARTSNGRVTVRFHAGGQSGVARIRAFSGAANTGTTDRTGGGTAAQTAEVEIRVGVAAAGRISLSATPGTVPAGGGTTTLVANVLDTNGNALAGVPVTFSTTAGTLSASSAITDDNGNARVQLTTSVAAEVTARAGVTAGGTSGTTVQEAKINVAVGVAPSVTITVPTTPPAPGDPAIFTITPALGQGAAALRDVVVDFGDGDRQSLGALTGTTSVAHVYQNPGTYTVTVTATSVAGDVTRTSAIIVVRARDPLSITVTPSTLTPAVNTPMTVTVAVTSGTTPPAVSRYEYNFGDGTTVVLNSPSTTHVYTTPGPETITVRVVTADGRTAVGQAQINVLP